MRIPVVKVQIPERAKTNAAKCSAHSCCYAYIWSFKLKFYNCVNTKLQHN